MLKDTTCRLRQPFRIECESAAEVAEVRRVFGDIIQVRGLKVTFLRSIRLSRVAPAPPPPPPPIVPFVE